MVSDPRDQIWLRQHDSQVYCQAPDTPSCEASARISKGTQLALNVNPGRAAKILNANGVLAVSLSGQAYQALPPYVNCPFLYADTPNTEPAGIEALCACVNPRAPEGSM
jgi:hypothetical protein